MSAEQSNFYDVVVIGGGVVGCAVLRELSRFRLKILLLEREADLAEGISKANSGVIHAGFNVPPGTLKAEMNVKGLFDIYELAQQLSVPHKKTGKLVVALDDDGKERLIALKAQGEKNSTPDLEIIGQERIKALEPLAAGKWALWSPHTGIISPYQFTVALAECAWQNGASVRLESPVTSISTNGHGFTLQIPDAEIKTRWVVNSAGLFSDIVASLAGIDGYRIFPYRGEYLITDKDDELNLRLPIYPVPPKDGPGLGVHITPTMEHNILLGPSADAIDDKRDTASTRRIMTQLKREAYDLMPELRKLSFIHSYAGIRPKLVDPAGNIKFKDFVIEESAAKPGWINLIGIESPGLTAAPAIAKRIVQMIGAKEDLSEKSDFNPGRPELPRFAELDDQQRTRLVAENPDWGEMVCRCETVTRAEVAHAIDNPLNVHALDAIKRRSRCGMGRCQGGFCTPRIVEILRQKGYSDIELTKRGGQSRLFYGKIKE
ncbi:NAD(P)/FAD-dependent oxidoreductase [candidate division KSB1 bacterium]|nr:NAD(P)/FAD-dependent oxidoreductase [candidate division KSB1 bacterium]